MDIGPLDAKDIGKGKDNGKGKAKDKPDNELTCYCCSKGGPSKGRLLELVGSTEGEGEEGSEEGRRAQEGEEAAVDVGSPEVGPTERLCERVLNTEPPHRTRTTHTFFSCEHQSASSAHFQYGHTRTGSR